MGKSLFNDYAKAAFIVGGLCSVSIVVGIFIDYFGGNKMLSDLFVQSALLILIVESTTVGIVLIIKFLKEEE